MYIRVFYSLIFYKSRGNNIYIWNQKTLSLCFYLTILVGKLLIPINLIFKMYRAEMPVFQEFCYHWWKIKINKGGFHILVIIMTINYYVFCSKFIAWESTEAQWSVVSLHSLTPNKEVAIMSFLVTFVKHRLLLKANMADMCGQFFQTLKAHKYGK